MSTQFTCDDKQTLIAYLYGEVDASVRTAVDDHIAGCADCHAEVIALGDVRSELGLWVPPDAELDFKIVKRSESNVLRPPRWIDSVPAWAQAAAAVLVLAAGAAIANVQVKSGPEGFVVSTGWMQPAVAVTPVATPSDEAWKPALAALRQQLHEEIKSTRDQSTPVAARGPVDEDTIRRVQQLISDAEQRHERALAARLIDFQRDVTMQRRADMQNIGRVVGSYDEQLLRTRQQMNNLIRVSNTPQQ